MMEEQQHSASRTSSRNARGNGNQMQQMSSLLQAPQMSHDQQGIQNKESPASAMLRLSPDRWILQPSNYGNGAMHVTVPPTARRGRGDSASATRSGDPSVPMMGLQANGMVGVEGCVSMDSHMNDNTKSCRVYSFPAQLLDIIEDEDSLDADAPPPPHAALVNYPTGSASERRARVNPTNSNRKKGVGKSGNPNQQHCVMCGRGTESDNVVIPVQNKQVCTDCDTGVWLYKADNTYFKWCKGCKRFRSIHAFREKLQGLRGATRTTCLPSKCDACRCRGRLGYRAKKEAVVSCYKGEDGEDLMHNGQTRAGRSASLDALLLTGLANNNNQGDDMNEDGQLESQDEGGPNKKQKRAIKTMKSNKDKRGRKGKNMNGMHLPMGLSMPMGIPPELSMGMQMGVPLSMMPGGLPLSFHHAMYLQQQQQQQGQGNGQSVGNGDGNMTLEQQNRLAAMAAASNTSGSSGGNANGQNPALLYNSPFSQQLVECLMKMPMYSNGSNNGASNQGQVPPPPLQSAEQSTEQATKKEDTSNAVGV